jgi:hypothetical protein
VEDAAPVVEALDLVARGVERIGHPLVADNQGATVGQ